MKRTIFVIALISLGLTLKAQNAIPSAAIQIKTAELAAPADKRGASSVYGYSEKGEFILLRKGTNEMICLADDPKTPGLNVACYHQDLEPFMKRGRELKSQGKTPKEVTDIRDHEAKSGWFPMPKQPASLFVYTAKAENFDPMTGTVKDGYLRYVVYIPYATAESTGLPLKPDVPGMPWLMDPGTHRAHIMISPPQKN
ncbi:MAG: hypothetical protein Q8S11_00875 [Daejeonella sp.]|uniref:hypothetical protein n=1 Tax=Daejeonella sp. TaxID=2805397 RepID=UPI0027326A26|nr:hypothetical protein [Daejeonella sp.]MDP3466856.1 hypothetical protein [Daejeonella sp.]